MPKPIAADRQMLLRLFMFTAKLCGRISMLAFGVFIFAGPFGHLEKQTSAAGWLMRDTLLSALFFVQHSAMMRRALRAQMSKWIPAYCHGAVFTLASAIALGAIMLFWLPSGVTVMELHGPARWLVNIIFLGAVAGIGWGALALHPFDPMGTAPLKAHLSGTPEPPPPTFAVRGPYLWVRHPLYFFLLVMLWARPDLTTDRLLFNLLWSAWIFAGTVLEERDLLSDFGDQYRQYQKMVPMLIPWKGHIGDARNLNTN